MNPQASHPSASARALSVACGAALGLRGPALCGAALAMLLIASLPLGGCGLSVVGHRLDPFGRSSKPRSDSQPAAPAPDRLAEAREQSALAPAEPYWPYRLAELQVATDSLASAEAALQTSLQRNPSYTPALALLSKLHFKARRHTEAVQMLEAARARPGAFPDGFPATLLAGLALHYEAMGETERARTLAGQMARPDLERVGSALVYLELRGTNPDTAAGLAKSALGRGTNSAVNQNNYGITRLRAGDADGARRAFQKAIELDPGLPGPYYNLAILEKYYVFDDQASARWLALYRQRATDDPDGLVENEGEAGPGSLAGRKDAP
ncbi:MAG TPA: tetratricopeptide repeat protein [Candidatus Limnocylindria bacterium]|nr:tetratricopeptide repeat protein [Candidatus Limnocylindria bacterium]